MIINASGRCDIVGYYMPWFINRIKAGFVDVRNPFYFSQISRISLLPEDIDCIVFCTKNPIPLIKYHEELSKYQIMLQVTITPYRKDIEPYVPDKKLIIQAIKALSEHYGKTRIQVRFDPILLTEEYTIEYHELMFKRLCTQLEGYIDTIIISFVDRMKNTRKNEEKMGMLEISEADMREVGKRFSNIAEKCDIHLKMCAETVDLSEFGILNEPCFGPIEFYKTTGKIKKIKKGNLRKNCDCLSMADIGAYNCCAHLCRYCYANYDEDKIHENMKLHDPESTMILGHLHEDDIIKIRK